MPHGRHAKDTPHHWHWVGAVAAVLAVLSISVATAEWFTQPPTEQRAEPRAATTAANEPEPRDPSLTRLAECHPAWDAQADTLVAAGRSLAQWRLHVGAMNQLVAGDISLAQASAYWNRTRVGAAARAADFEQAAGAYSVAAPRCVGLNGASLPADASGPLQECVSGVRARDEAIEAASVSVTTWQHHMNDMDMLKAGQITPAQATRKWLDSWRAGVRQLDTFRAVHADAARAGSC
jgi:hypothetical protein